MKKRKWRVLFVFRVLVCVCDRSTRTPSLSSSFSFTVATMITKIRTFNKSREKLFSHSYRGKDSLMP